MAEPRYEPSPRPIVRQQVEDYERSGGTELSFRSKLPIIILITCGARSQLIRKTPLMRVERDGAYLAVASLGGSDNDPQWVHNIRAESKVALQDGPTIRQLRAAELSGAEREAWWRYAVQTYPLYAEYQSRTERLIPLFLLKSDQLH